LCDRLTAHAGRNARRILVRAKRDAWHVAKTDPSLPRANVEYNLLPFSSSV
jgi:hypothetical protein